MNRPLATIAVIAVTAIGLSSSTEVPPNHVQASPDRQHVPQVTTGEVATTVSDEAAALATEQEAVSTVAVSLQSTTPDESSSLADRRHTDFLTAVAQNCMGWFCEKYGLGYLELGTDLEPYRRWSGDNEQMLLYRAVAAAVAGSDSKAGTRAAANPAEIDALKSKVEQYAQRLHEQDALIAKLQDKQRFTQPDQTPAPPPATTSQAAAPAQAAAKLSRPVPVAGVGYRYYYSEPSRYSSYSYGTCGPGGCGSSGGSSGYRSGPIRRLLFNR